MIKDYIFFGVRTLGYIALFAFVFFYEAVPLRKGFKIGMLALGTLSLIVGGLVIGRP